jgi:hypothetical protein
LIASLLEIDWSGKTFEQLKVAPEIGKAVLFYSQLPDGNMDDFSQHAALPVIRGEKWLVRFAVVPLLASIFLTFDWLAAPTR